MKRLVFATVAFLWPIAAFAQEKAIAPEALEFFEKKVRPVLVQHCYECHSAMAKKLKGGLLIDSRAGMLHGGDNGPALVPGAPDKSRLIEAIRYTKVDLKMPRNGKLPDAVIADLTAWVKMGALVLAADPRARDAESEGRRLGEERHRPLSAGEAGGEGAETCGGRRPGHAAAAVALRYCRVAADARGGGGVCQGVGCRGR
jgi:hypothetical protein